MKRQYDSFIGRIGVSALLLICGASDSGPIACAGESQARDTLAGQLEKYYEPPAEFAGWLSAFLPRVDLEPTRVIDFSDAKLYHLAGLNLSRAWCMRGIASALPKNDAARKALTESAATHSEAALRHVASGDYAGEHWLASFAVYLLTAAE